MRFDQKHVRELLHHTVVYTIGNFVYRAASFLLIPLYVRALQPAEYGVLELITATTTILGAVLSSGIAHATLRYYFEYESPEDRNAVISTALLTMIGFTGLAVTVAALNARHLAMLVFGSAEHTTAFQLACFCITFEIAREIALAYVRAQQRSGLFIAMSIIQLLVQVAASVFTVVHLRMGVLGILAANLFATACVAGVLTSVTLRSCGFAIRLPVLRALQKYGQPLMLAGLAASLFQSLDRYVLNATVGLQALGTYALALRIATIIPVLIVTPFTSSYGPYRFSIMREPAAQETYARVARYYLIAACLCMAAIASYSDVLVALIAAPEYAGAAAVAPILVIPGALGGLTYCFQTALYMEKSTRPMFYISAMEGAIRLAAILLLVPFFGLTGAAIAAMLSYAYTLTHTYIAAQRLRYIPYEPWKLARIFGAAVALVLVAIQVRAGSVWTVVGIRLALLGCYPLLIAGVTGPLPPWIRLRVWATR